MKLSMKWRNLIKDILKIMNRLRYNQCDKSLNFLPGCHHRNHPWVGMTYLILSMTLVIIIVITRRRKRRKRKRREENQRGRRKRPSVFRNHPSQTQRSRPGKMARALSDDGRPRLANERPTREEVRDECQRKKESDAISLKVSCRVVFTERDEELISRDRTVADNVV